LLSPRQKSIPIFFIALGLFGLYTIEFGVVGILPAIMERYHVSAAQAGTLVGVFALVIAVLGPFMVLFLSSFNRKRILILSLLIFAASSVLSSLTGNFYVLLAMRIVPALFHPVFFSLAFSAAVSLYPKEQATRAAAQAFVGTSMGMVIGVPMTTFIADQFSIEASYVFTALVNLAAACGIALVIPKTAEPVKITYRQQLGILLKAPLWINIGAATFLFAAMFSVYSYAAEYLGQAMGASERLVSLLLVLFGIGGVAGNLLAGRLLGIHMARTTLLQPIALGLSYWLLSMGELHWVLLAVIVIVWGAAHTSGLVVSQTWMTSEAPEAPEFVNSLYVSFINLGVTIGSFAGGSLIAISGMKGTITAGLFFIGLTVVCIAAKVMFFSGKRWRAQQVHHNK